MANSLSLPQLEAPIIKREVLPSLTQGLKRHYREYFSDWFEPGSQISARGSQGNMRRRASRKKKLHQKLVLSQVGLEELICDAMQPWSSSAEYLFYNLCKSQEYANHKTYPSPSIYPF